VLLAFNQQTNYLGEATPRPASAVAEVRGHSYRVAVDGAVSLHYTVLAHNEDTVDQFGGLLTELAVKPLFGPPDVAIAEVNQATGVEPPVRVPMALVIAPGTVLAVSDARALRDFRGRYMGYEERGTTLASIILHTVAQVCSWPSCHFAAPHSTSPHSTTLLHRRPAHSSLR
jgi:hypothetical protein